MKYKVDGKLLFTNLVRQNRIIWIERITEQFLFIQYFIYLIFLGIINQMKQNYSNEINYIYKSYWFKNIIWYNLYDIWYMIYMI